MRKWQDTEMLESSHYIVFILHSSLYVLRVLKRLHKSIEKIA